MPIIAFLLAVLLAWTAWGQECGSRTAVRPIPAGDVALTMFLVGDAGLKSKNCVNKTLCNDPVLEALEEDVTARAEELGKDNVVVVFLGDNVYIYGLTRSKLDRARLDAQVDVVRRSDVRGYFVPGNHDWNLNDVGGLERIRRQAARLAELAAAPDGPRVSLRPGDACPGPEVETFGTAASLVFVDTAWWLQPAQDRPKCGGETAALNKLRDALKNLSTPAVIVAHHAFEKSAGKHGTTGTGKQDFGGSENKKMRNKLRDAVLDSGTRPLLWASGHDHSLGLLSGGTAKYHVTSGAGFEREPTLVKCGVSGLVFGVESTGWVVLDFPKDRTAPRLEVREVPDETPRFSRRLD
jgi:hypothetical protein